MNEFNIDINSNISILFYINGYINDYFEQLPIYKPHIFIPHLSAVNSAAMIILLCQITITTFLRILINISILTMPPFPPWHKGSTLIQLYSPIMLPSLTPPHHHLTCFYNNRIITTITTILSPLNHLRPSTTWLEFTS